MSKEYIRVDKDFLKLELNPTEILTLSLIVGFNTNKQECFVSDETMSQYFGVSTKTISRSLKSLEDKGFITRKTKNIKGGRERILVANTANISAALAKEEESGTEDSTMDNKSVVKIEEPKNSTTDKLSVDNGQFVF